MKRAAILPQGRSGLSPDSGDGGHSRFVEGGARSSTREASAAAKPSRLWFWFVAAFFVQAAAWTAWLVIAAHHRVQEIPLAP